MEKNIQKAKILFVLWIISYIVVSFLSNVYVHYQKTVLGYNPISMLSGYQLFSLAIMVVYFIPLLLAVHHFSKLSQSDKLRKITLYILCFLCLYTAVLLFFTIGAIIYA
jgi:4-amino-4-deoxy-L-arabinose transferase-like glycosyltransferase